MDEDFIYLRYHRAKNPADEGRVLVCHRDDDAYWLDGLRERCLAPRRALDGDAFHATAPV
ncbi:MAG: hypothetical protein R3E12_03190 [Candidatus Eisenbacteria bacterium]